MTMIELTVAATVERFKAEIEEHMRTGVVPRQVSSFAQLHDFVDANCYGSLCEEEVFDGLIAQFGGRDEHEGMPQGMIDFINEVEDTVDKWLKENL